MTEDGGRGTDIAIAAVGLVLALAVVLTRDSHVGAGLGLVALQVAVGAAALRLGRPARDVAVLVGMLGPGIVAAQLTGVAPFFAVGFFAFGAGLGLSAAAGTPR